MKPRSHLIPHRRSRAPERRRREFKGSAAEKHGIAVMPGDLPLPEHAAAPAWRVL